MQMILKAVATAVMVLCAGLAGAQQTIKDQRGE